MHDLYDSASDRAHVSWFWIKTLVVKHDGIPEHGAHAGDRRADCCPGLPVPDLLTLHEEQGFELCDNVFVISLTCALVATWFQNA